MLVLTVGKPVSAGLIFVSIFCVACLIFVPFDARCLWTLPLVLAAMLWATSTTAAAGSPNTSLR